MRSKKRTLKQVQFKSSTRFSTPKTDVRPNYDIHRPIFSFYHMQYGQNNCLSLCDQASKAAVASRLLKLSQLTWSKINSESKEGFGFEMIPREQFKVRIPSAITPDISSLMVFRFSQSGRMAGFRKDDIYHIAIVSPIHNIY